MKTKGTRAAHSAQDTSGRTPSRQAFPTARAQSSRAERRDAARERRSREEESGSEGIDDSTDAVFEAWRVEVDQEPQRLLCRAQLREQLCHVHGQERVYRLHLHDEL